MAHSALAISHMGGHRRDRNRHKMCRIHHHVAKIQSRHWDERKRFNGIADNGDFFPMVQISGHFWAWLAEATKPEHDSYMMADLYDPTQFRLGNTLPTTSFENDRWFTFNNGRIHADVRPCTPTGLFLGRWISPPTMIVLRGLRNNGYHHFSHEVASDVLLVHRKWHATVIPSSRSGVDLEGIRVYAEFLIPSLASRNRQGKAFRLVNRA